MASALPYMTLFLAIGVGVLMVSKVRYFSFKEYDFLRAHPIRTMAIEAGGKVGLFAVDAKTRAYCAEHKRPGLTQDLAADPGAVYERVVNIDVTDKEPVVACPHLPSNVKPVSEVRDTPIQQVVIGSCTNGRISDMRDAAEVLRGRKVAKHLRCIVLPSTPTVWKQCLKEGLIETFMWPSRLMPVAMFPTAIFLTCCWTP